MKDLFIKSLYYQFSFIGFLCFTFFDLVAPKPDNLQDAQQTGTVEIMVSNIKKDKGTVEIALYNSKKNWLKSGGACQVKRIAVDGESVIVSFSALSHGTYAMVAYHDVNNNQNFDCSWIGIPKEPYAMTRRAKSKLRKPKFKEMAFTLDKDRHFIEVEFRKF